MKQHTRGHRSRGCVVSGLSGHRHSPTAQRPTHWFLRMRSRWSPRRSSFQVRVPQFLLIRSPLLSTCRVMISLRLARRLGRDPHDVPGWVRVGDRMVQPACVAGSPATMWECGPWQLFLKAPLTHKKQHISLTIGVVFSRKAVFPTRKSQVPTSNLNVATESL